MLRNDESMDRVSKETILCALSNESVASTLSDGLLYSTIQEQMERGEYGMDNELIDTCTQLLWNRHSTITQKQLEKSKHRSIKKLRQLMKRSAASSRPKNFHLRPIAIAMMIILIIAFPMLIANPPFKVSTTHDGEQYLVVGIQKNDTGIARASMNRDTIGTTVELNSVEAIAPLLGYAMELPSWIPKECSIENITLARDVAFDELLVIYAGGNGKRISLLVTYYDTRDGHSAGYEQVKKGHLRELQNGASVYVANNINSSWGLYQSSNMDYSIDLIGFDESTLIKVFNSIRR